MFTVSSLKYKVTPHYPSRVAIVFYTFHRLCKVKAHNKFHMEKCTLRYTLYFHFPVLYMLTNYMQLYYFICFPRTYVFMYLHKSFSFYVWVSFISLSIVSLQIQPQSPTSVKFNHRLFCFHFYHNFLRVGSLLVSTISTFSTGKLLKRLDH